MNLATAIRKGALQRGHCRLVLYDQTTDSTCTLGAAYEGVFGVPPRNSYSNLETLDNVYRELRTQFPELTMRPPAHILDEVSARSSILPTNLEHCIITLNDYLGKSREEIADLLEFCESAG